MTNNNKILTVSYGTFSCTLEGFEDSFGTMKAIAEYFRDLAADDRYFGAEPPQPDAEMLARIAQKEVSRRVQARQQDGQIVLSALAAPSEEPAAEAAAAPPAPVEAPAAPRLRAVETAPVAEAVEEDEEEDQIEELVSLSDEPAFEEDEQDIVPGQPDAEVEAFFAASEPAAPTEEEAEAEVAPRARRAEARRAAPGSESIAAKLERIRAVVSRKQEAEQAALYLEDEHAEVAEDDEDEDEDEFDVIADARADIESALEADDDAEEAAAPATLAGEEDALSALLTRIKTEEAEAEEAPDAPAPQRQTRAERLAERRAARQAARREETAEEDDAEESVANLFEEKAKDAPAPVEQPRARVIKVRRADLEAAIQKGALEEVEEETAEKDTGLDALAPAKREHSSLSAEEEAELARELSDLTAGIEDDTDEDTAEYDEDETDEYEQIEETSKVVAAPARVARKVLPDLDEDDSGDVNRLLAETNQQMDEPEGANRRDAFAHLRAAVAAKKADASIEVDEAATKSAGAYRDDLAEVVRPRRPANGQARTQRPADARPAPLKLVAEQRIDIDRPAPAAPVRPRRVAGRAEIEAVPTDGTGFAEFAEEMGASTLPELLEAAAAYLSFVEGREQFSRPQLMSKVRQANGEDGFSREEGLRHFGQLLRKGKISKIKGGRFTVSEDIGFRPDQRAAG